MDRFIKSAYAAQVVKDAGLPITQAVKNMYACCPACDPGPYDIQDGWVVLGVTRKQLDVLGVKSSSTRYTHY